MADAIRRIGIARGRDLAGHTLVCFGGAGGQHACLVADELGLGRIHIHPRAGLLSAYGMGLADRSILRVQAVEAPLGEAAGPLRALADRLAAEAVRALAEDGADPARLAVERRVQLRYAGSESWIVVGLDEPAAMAAAFAALHRRRYGFASPGRPLLVQAVEVEATSPGEAVPEPVLPARTGGAAAPVERGADLGRDSDAADADLRARRPAGRRPR